MKIVFRQNRVYHEVVCSLCGGVFRLGDIVANVIDGYDDDLNPVCEVCLQSDERQLVKRIRGFIDDLTSRAEFLQDQIDRGLMLPDLSQKARLMAKVSKEWDSRAIEVRIYGVRESGKPVEVIATLTLSEPDIGVRPDLLQIVVAALATC